MILPFRVPAPSPRSAAAPRPPPRRQRALYVVDFGVEGCRVWDSREIKLRTKVSGVKMFGVQGTALRDLRNRGRVFDVFMFLHLGCWGGLVWKRAVRASQVLQLTCLPPKYSCRKSDRTVGARRSHVKRPQLSGVVTFLGPVVRPDRRSDTDKKKGIFHRCLGPLAASRWLS